MSPSTDDPNFRLATSVRPQRYQAEISLDIKGRQFSGRETIAIRLERSADELVLHANKLELRKAELRAGGRSRIAQTIRVASQSETVTLNFGEPVEAGDALLDIEWTGAFNEGLRGLYQSGNVAATQFEAADARRVFPCFDEPLFKATWALRIRAPSNLTVLSNGRLLTQEQDGEWRTSVFEETEVLSSYLIAFVCGELVSTQEERAEGVPVRTWAVPAKAHLMRFGQDVALAALPRLQEYFGLPYAFGKVDQVGIPDFEAGAMENAGLITYRELALLLDSSSASLASQKRIAEVVTHELSHQWFGNWVTMVWWDDLWLNEAFATWMAYKIVDAWRPDWRVWLDFDAGKASALVLDALTSTHPIRGVVNNANEAGESFDVITYEKGGAVLRMIEGYLGEAPFREGIRLYMRTHARANATADDLWAALTTASGQPVIEVANAWIRQSGFPLISASIAGSTVRLTQRRFYSEPGLASKETWPVPIKLRFADDGGVHEHRLLLRDVTVDIPLPVQGKLRWLCANAGSTGFYRVSYDDGALSQLAENLASLEPSERVNLLADRWALVRADLCPMSHFLELAARFGAEEDDAVLDQLVGRLGYIEHRLVEGEDVLRFRAWVEQLLAPQLRQLGWDTHPAETDRTRLRRGAIISALAGVARAAPAVAEARSRANRVLAGAKDALEPNLLDAAVHTAARHGDARFFDLLRAKFPSEPDPASKRRYLMSLTGFEEASLAQRALEMLFAKEVPMQDVSTFVSGLLGNRTARDSTWAALQQRWPEVLVLTGGAPMLLRRVIEALGNLQQKAHLDGVRAFLQQHPLPEAQQAIAQTLERLTQDVALRERALPQVAAWLRRAG